MARDQSALRAAVHAQFLAAIDLEDDNALTFLKEFQEASTNATPDELLRLASCRLIHAYRVGPVEEALEVTRPLGALVSSAIDPVIVSSFLIGRARALHAAARFEESWAAALEAHSEASRAHLEFALPHIAMTRAHAAIGLRRFGAYRRLMDEIAGPSKADAQLAGNAAILRAHRELSRRNPAAAAKVLASAPDAPDRATRAEIDAYLSLALALTGDLVQSEKLRVRAAATSRGTESRVVLRITDAIAAENTLAFPAQLAAATALAVSTGFLEPAVIAARAWPTFTNEVLRMSDRDRGLASLRRALESWASEADSHPQLSRREHEVLELVARGLSNRQIAEELFLSEPTVKVHLRHTYEKLGVRNRAEAVARRAAIDQAASATSTDSAPA
jgi:DNA-binding NarL/FixJ family response regulator